MVMTICGLILLYSCDCSDEEFSIARKPYFGNEIKTNGYFYSCDSTSGRTSIRLFYRHGIVLFGGAYSSSDLDSIEQEFLEHIEVIRNDKTVWAPFEVKGNTLIIETYYDNPPSRRLRTQRLSHDIQNDTTIVWKNTDHPGYKDKVHNVVWHFKQLSSKPDSTNVFIY
jgi:hypothetical protein